jgi:hypothetical protein
MEADFLTALFAISGRWMKIKIVSTKTNGQSPHYCHPPEISRTDPYYGLM